MSLIILIIIIILYLLIAGILFTPFSLENGVHHPAEYTLKSFYYAIFFPVTFIYRYFNGGYLE